MNRNGKFYLTERLVKRIGNEQARQIVAKLAGIEIAPESPDKLAEAINALPAESRDDVTREFRNIQMIARTPKVKPTIIRIMMKYDSLDRARDVAYYLAQLNHTDLARIAAYLYLTLPAAAWREICMMARHFAVAESSWLAFELDPASDFTLATDDDSLADLRKAICAYIFTNEGRADEGWGSHYFDEGTREHCFSIDMTDHLQSKKERIDRNTFRILPKKEVFDVLFRYKPELKELSIRAEGPRAYRQKMCEIFLTNVGKSRARLLDARNKYKLEAALKLPTELTIPDDSPILAASIIGIELVNSVNDDQRLVLRRFASLPKIIAAICEASGLPPFAYKVNKVEIDFTYRLPTLETAHDIRYMRPDTDNIVRAPDAIKLAVPPLLELNGFL